MYKNYIKFLATSVIILGYGITVINNNCYCMDNDAEKKQFEINVTYKLLDEVRELQDSIWDKLYKYEYKKDQYYNIRKFRYGAFGSLSSICSDIASRFTFTEDGFFAYYNERANAKITIDEINNGLLPLNLTVTDISTDNKTITAQQFVNFYQCSTLLLLKNEYETILQYINNVHNEKDKIYKVNKLIIHCVNKINSYCNTFLQLLSNNLQLKQVMQHCTNNQVSIKDRLSICIKQLNELQHKYTGFLEFGHCTADFDDLDQYEEYDYEKYNNIVIPCDKDHTEIHMRLTDKEILLNKNLTSECDKLLLDFLNALQNSAILQGTDGYKVFNEFIRCYTSLTNTISHMFLDSLFEDYQDKMPKHKDSCKWNRKYLSENIAGIFNLDVSKEDIDFKQLLQYFVNEITLLVMYTMQYFLEKLISPTINDWHVHRDMLKPKLLSCVQEMKELADPIVKFLKNDKQFNETISNTDIVTALNAGMEQCDKFIKLYTKNNKSKI